MTTNNLLVNEGQSNVLIKVRRSMNKYLKTRIRYSKGTMSISDNQLEDMSVEFVLEVISNGNYTFLANNEVDSVISFTSIAFQKVSPTLNFIKGYLTINGITKIVELEASVIYLNDSEVLPQAVLEIFGNINKKDFGWFSNEFRPLKGFPLEKNIKLMANLEFDNFVDSKDSVN